MKIENVRLSMMKGVKLKSESTEEEWKYLCKFAGADEETTTQIYVNARFEFDGNCKD